MARARNIKPSFFQNDELGEQSPLARLLFIGMWTIADFKGCLEFRPKRIKAQLLPYDDCNIEQLANDLDKSGFISIYSVQGQPYIKIINFERHQNPHKNEREAGSDCPDISEKDNEISKLSQDGKNREQDGTTRADSLFLIPDSLFPPTDPGIPHGAALPLGDDSQKITPKNVAAEDDTEFMEAWGAYPKRPGASRADSYKAWRARIKEGVKPEDLIAGVRRYADHVMRSGTEPKFIKQPETFFGPGRHYEAAWEPLQSGSAQQPAKWDPVAHVNRNRVRS